MERRIKPGLLLVDDDAHLRRALTRLLKRDFIVTDAGSGEEALQSLARGAEFQAILCDLNMANMDGVELYNELRARRANLCSRVIFMSGGGIKPAHHDFLLNTANPVLEKPVSPEDLFGALHRLVDSSTPHVD